MDIHQKKGKKSKGRGECTKLVSFLYFKKDVLYPIRIIVVNFRVKSNKMNKAHIHAPPAKTKTNRK